MSGAIAASAYAVVLASSVWAAGPLERPRHRRPPLLTAGALAVIGTVSVLQLTAFPGLLGALERNRTAIADGQVTRLVTSLVVQDGGWAGTVFNLVALLVVGVTAEQLWSRRRWLLIALSAGVGAQFWGLVVQPVGAGNSVLVFGLAASLLVLALHSGPPPSRVLAVVGLLTGSVLLFRRDVHGGAVLIGAAVSLVITVRAHRRAS